MLSEPRTVSLIAELVHIPAVHSGDRLREVYNEVCRTCGYENFLRLQGGARIERRDPDREGFSQLNLLGDRIQLTEDHNGITIEQFGKKIVAVLTAASAILHIPIFLVQQNTVRIAATPNSFKSASEYLLSVFKIEPDDLKPLGRPTSVFGFRLLFPPAKGQPQNYNVRIESYLRDPKALYIENVATFKTPIPSGSLAQVEKNLQQTSDFLGDNVVKFLSQYDRKEEA
jgi:hypothetical protein